MSEYILAGLLLLLAADYIQIAEEWKARGLTDTSYKVVLSLIAGPLCIAYGFKDIGQAPYAYLFTGLAVCAGIMLSLKLRDFIQTRYRTLT